MPVCLPPLCLLEVTQQPRALCIGALQPVVSARRRAGTAAASAAAAGAPRSKSPAIAAVAVGAMLAILLLPILFQVVDSCQQRLAVAKRPNAQLCLQGAARVG